MILNSCEHGDSIIVYAGVPCPICELENEVSKLQNQNANLQNDYDMLETELEDLRREK